jgi:outer membrane receptor for ferrienterochelin and colicins
MQSKLCFFFLLILFVNLSTLNCFAQIRDISGKVIDYTTRKPLSGVQVKISGINQTSVTDKDGNYKISVPDSYLDIEFKSFTGKRLSDKEKISENNINLYLSDLSENEIYDLSLEELMNIKVDIASKYSEPIDDAPGVVSVVTAKEIEDFGATSLRDILERVTGVVGLTGFGNRNVINLRGDQLLTSSKHVLILINGRPTRERIASGEDMEVYAMFPINCIERIEVIRGSGSVLYGTNAFTGVINIITKQSPEYFSASYSGATPTASLISVSGATKMGNGTFSGGLYYKNLQDWKQSFTTELGIYSSANTREEGLGANVAYNIGDFNVNSTLILLNNFIANPQRFGDYGDFIRHFVNIGYEYKFSDKIKTTINATNTYYYYEGFPIQPKRTSNDFLAEIITYYHPNERLNLLTGGIVNRISGIVKRQTNNVVIATMPWYNEVQYSFYTQADYQLYSRLKAVGGFQINKHSTDVPVKFVPRVGLIWQPTRKMIYKALYAEAYRAPSAAETTSSDIHRFGNPKLKPEYVNSFDFEIRYIEKKIQPALTFFIYKQENNVALDQSNPQKFINKGEFSAKGIEFEMKFIPTSKLYFTGSASYQTNLLNDSIKDTSTGAVTAKFGVSYSFKTGLSIGIFNIYNSPPPDIVWNNPNRKLVNHVPESFNLLSANINYNLAQFIKAKGMNLILNLRADNLLDEEINTPEWVSSKINSLPGKPGRRIYFGLKVNL